MTNYERMPEVIGGVNQMDRDELIKLAQRHVGRLYGNVDTFLGDMERAIELSEKDEYLKGEERLSSTEDTLRRYNLRLTKKQETKRNDLLEKISEEWRAK